ncbi:MULTISPECIES: hypothetical protein [Tsukamurella]|uniref:Uncharacterized protein n=1 Tax=Tsukamurella strandjordii TaxID=147577 RepID=A0AA90NLL5_9ACTN|nr:MULTISPECIES: hypothetical protein [Tsukamurella]MDP0396724.1 hypothetical protein [Tsukamurella strandjordii]GIZ96525.1 hypothetical protein TTY48_11370 [Tsukamurella sp. TY48]
MCHAVPCRTCGKTTWAGCGSHVDAVRAMVAPQDWCAGHAAEEPAATRRRLPWFR